MSFIEFYDRNSPYFEFSNFYPAKIFLDGEEWLTSEHYYQASKFIGSQHSLDYSFIIRQADTPGKAFLLARQSASGYKANWILNQKDPIKIGNLIDFYKGLGVKLRSDWTQVRDQIMYKGVSAKFSQNPELKDLLLRTGQTVLVENVERDRHWGNGGLTGDGIPQSQGGTMKGENKLGQILMKIRNELNS